jgi:hypothetical protein
MALTSAILLRTSPNQRTPPGLCAGHFILEASMADLTPRMREIRDALAPLLLDALLDTKARIEAGWPSTPEDRVALEDNLAWALEAVRADDLRQAHHLAQRRDLKAADGTLAAAMTDHEERQANARE